MMERANVTVRMGHSLKARAEACAWERGVSLNAFLLEAIETEVKGCEHIEGLIAATGGL
jgi:predicted HicB family RNase H-like nuclease